MIKIYNTLKRKKENFVPLNKDKVGCLLLLQQYNRRYKIISSKSLNSIKNT